MKFRRDDAERWKAANRARARRREQAAVFGDEHRQLGFADCGPDRWEVSLGGDLLVYHPMAGKWYWRGMVVWGSWESLSNMVRRYSGLPAPPAAPRRPAQKSML